ERARLVALRDELTSNSLHDEDSIGHPDRIRERVFGAIFAIGGSLQPPFEQHEAALDALKLDVGTAYSHISAVLGFDFASKALGIRRMSEPAGGAIIVMPTPTPTPSP
ncbi:MAG TPA: hypothetical protein VN224_02795, partial [Xanthomonadales bacterium]|nr:hypothetical protein [Xanthomonadales bacterium]